MHLAPPLLISKMSINPISTSSHHLKLWKLLTWLLKIAITKSLVEEENPFSFYDGYQNLRHSTTSKSNVLKVTSTQTWKITSMWKFSFCEHLSSPHWPMNEPKFYPQVWILHRGVVSSLWVEPIKLFVKSPYLWASFSPKPFF